MGAEEQAKTRAAGCRPSRSQWTGNRGRGGDTAAGRSAGNSTTGGSTKTMQGASSGAGGMLALSGGDSNKGDAVLTFG